MKQNPDREIIDASLSGTNISNGSITVPTIDDSQMGDAGSDIQAQNTQLSHPIMLQFDGANSDIRGISSITTRTHAESPHSTILAQEMITAPAYNSSNQLSEALQQESNHSSRTTAVDDYSIQFARKMTSMHDDIQAGNMGIIRLYNDIDTSLASVPGNLVQLGNATHTIHQSLITTQQSLVATQENVASTQQTVTSVQQDVVSLSERIDGKTAELHAKVDMMQDDIQAIKQDVTVLQRNMSSTKQDLVNIKSDVNTIKDGVEEIVRTMKTIHQGTETIEKIVDWLKQDGSSVLGAANDRTTTRKQPLKDDKNVQCLTSEIDETGHGSQGAKIGLKWMNIGIAICKNNDPGMSTTIYRSTESVAVQPDGVSTVSKLLRIINHEYTSEVRGKLLEEPEDSWLLLQNIVVPSPKNQRVRLSSSNKWLDWIRELESSSPDSTPFEVTAEFQLFVPDEDGRAAKRQRRNDDSAKQNNALFRCRAF